MSNQRYITFASIAAAVLVGITARSGVAEGFAIAGWADALFLGIPLSIFISVAIGFLAFFILLRTGAAVTFTDEVIVELRKIHWPDREETVNSTTVVLVACLVIASALAGFDFLWAKVTSFFLFS